MMRKLLAIALVMMAVAAHAAIISEGGRRAVILGGKPFVPVSSGAILQTDGVSHILLVGGGNILKVN